MQKTKYKLVIFVTSNVFLVAFFLLNNPKFALALQTTVYVDATFGPGNAGGHTWQVDAFSTVQDGINAVATDGTVNVAPGNYVTGAEITINKRFNLVGPGKNAPVAATITNNSCSARTMTIQKSGVHVTGLHFTESNGGGAPCLLFPVIRIRGVAGINTTGIVIDDDDVSGGVEGIAIRFDSSNLTISNNTLHDNDEHGLNLASQKNDQIFNNEIKNNDTGVLFQSGDSAGAAANNANDGQFNGTLFYSNNIHDNITSGIDVETSDQITPVTIGPSNSITANGYGIYFGESTKNMLFRQNLIFNNSAGGAFAATTDLNDAARNYWGATSGPLHSISNPAGTGNALVGNSSVNILYRPFYTNSGLTNLSTAITLDSANFSALLTSGSLTYVGPATSASELDANENITTNIPSSGSSSVLLQTGTVITPDGSSLLDTTQFNAASLSGSVLRNINGVVVGNAVQWGIPETGLNLSLPLTVNIFLGQNFNGQTFSIVRSISGIDNWTSVGIVENPASCTVSNGFCSFHSNKASYFAAIQAFGGAVNPAIFVLPKIPEPTPDNPEGGFKIRINAGKPNTSNRVVNLSFIAGPDVKKMAIANADDFLWASQETFVPAKQWDICGANPVCPDGPHTVYAKFYTAFGQPSTTVSAQIILRTGTNTITNFVSKKHKFYKNLQYGDTGADVKQLQLTLQILGFFPATIKPNGVFGPATLNSLKAFQKNSSLPQTGRLGPQTRAVLNQ